MIVWGMRCNKCQGNISLEHDEDGPYLSCVQCGNTEKAPGGVTIIQGVHQSMQKFSDPRNPIKAPASIFMD